MGWGVGGWGEKCGVPGESLKRLNYQFGFLVIIFLIIPRSSVFTSKWRCFIARACRSLADLVPRSKGVELKKYTVWSTYRRTSS